jgi:hypothetical protein
MKAGVYRDEIRLICAAAAWFFEPIRELSKTTNETFHQGQRWTVLGVSIKRIKFVPTQNILKKAFDSLKDMNK